MMRRNTAGMYTAARDDRLRPARRQVHSVLFQIRLQSFISEAVRSRRRSLCWVLGDWGNQVDPPARTVLRPVRQCQVRLSRAFTVARLMQLICVLCSAISVKPSVPWRCCLGDGKGIRSCSGNSSNSQKFIFGDQA